MPGSMDYARARINMVENQLRPNRIEDRALIEAMLNVPRERFVPKALAGVAYADEDLRLPDGRYLIEPLVAGAPDPERAGRPRGRGAGAGLRHRLRGGRAGPPGGDRDPAGAGRGIGDQGRAAARRARRRQRRGHRRRRSDRWPSRPGALRRDPARPARSMRCLRRSWSRSAKAAGSSPSIANERVGRGVLFTRLHGVIGQRTLFDAQIPRLAGVTREAEFAF